MTIETSTNKITASELAGRLSAVLDDVQAGMTFTITRHGHPVAVLCAGQAPGLAVDSAMIAGEAPAEYGAIAAADSAPMPATALARLIGSPSTRAVLAIFLLEPDRAVYQREAARRACVGLRSAQIALARLQELGLLAAERDGNRLYYRAVRTARFEDLRALMSRELGVTEVIARHLAGLSEPIVWAFIFGSAASGADRLDSDIDLFVVSEASDDALVEPIAGAQRELGREIDLVSYRPEEFTLRQAEGNHFIKSVLAQTRIDVTGSAHGL